VKESCLEPFVIDLVAYGGPVYSGRAAGEHLRSELQLDQVDASGMPIVFRVPAGTYTVSSGFFLGLLGPSIRQCSTEQAFLDRVTLDVPEFLLESLLGYVRAALAPRP
jgi:hypothetical protein